MTIETKFDLNDVVFTMYSDRIVKATINGVKFIKTNNMCAWKSDRSYNLQMEKGGYIDREEDQLFKEKEELIKSL